MDPPLPHSAANQSKIWVYVLLSQPSSWIDYCIHPSRRWARRPIIYLYRQGRERPSKLTKINFKFSGNIAEELLERWRGYARVYRRYEKTDGRVGMDREDRG